MTRQASGFSIFCLIAAIISLIYIAAYHIWLRPYELSHYVTQFSSLYGLLFHDLRSLCRRRLFHLLSSGLCFAVTHTAPPFQPIADEIVALNAAFSSTFWASMRHRPRIS